MAVIAAHHTCRDLARRAKAIPEVAGDLRPSGPGLRHHPRRAEETVCGAVMFAEPRRRPGLAQPFGVAASVVGQRVHGGHHHERRTSPGSTPHAAACAMTCRSASQSRFQV